MFKNIMQVGLIMVFACFSFYYTEKLSNITKSKDILMQEIVSKEDNYKVESVSATIHDDKIIPGLKGYKINVYKSYNNMKKLGIFNEYFLVYDKIKPHISIDEIYNKYIISGNDSNRRIALLFNTNDVSLINQSVTILNKKQAVGNFFIDGAWGDQNIDSLNAIIKNNKFLGNYGYENKYSNPTILYTNSLISRLTEQTKYYCLVEEEDSNILEVCKNKKMWTVLPSIITSDDIYGDIKKNISNGSIILIKLNDLNINELEITINYIKQKGYKIMSLDKLLEE